MPGVKPGVVAALNGAGYRRLEHLKGLTVDDLTAIKGIGKVSAEALIREVEQMSA